MLLISSLNVYCVMVYGSTFMRVISSFSELIVLSDTLEIAHFHRQMAPQYSQNCHRKLRKLQKSVQKFVRTTSYGWQTNFNKIPLQYFRAENVDVHLYKFLLQVATGTGSNCQTSDGGTKMARNKVCVLQKSYRK